MLDIQNVHKTFGENEILKGVNLTIAKGDVVVVLGPSGSGKTTLLRCINFLERADQGTANFDDIAVDLHKASKKDILAIRKKTAFVFQNYNLFNNKTALENVAEGLIIGRGMKKEAAYTISKQALDKVGLTEKYDAYPSQLSGGQQQRVGIARAVALNPDIILFDEPTSALDPELVGEVLGVMKDIAKEGTTMLVVTQKIGTAKTADKILLLEDGQVIGLGTHVELLATNTLYRKIAASQQEQEV